MRDGVAASLTGGGAKSATKGVFDGTGIREVMSFHPASTSSKGDAPSLQRDELHELSVQNYRLYAFVR